MPDWKGKYHVRYWKRKYSGNWHKTCLSMRSRGFDSEDACFKFVDSHPCSIYRVKVFRDGELIYEH